MKIITKVLIGCVNLHEVAEIEGFILFIIIGFYENSKKMVSILV